MMEVPWMMGITGNLRATNLAENGTVYYNNTHIKAQGWGCLSSDAVTNTRMFVTNCVLETTESGYGAFSLGNNVSTFSGTTFNVADMALVSQDGDGVFTDSCVINSGRFGVMFFGTGDYITIEKGTVFNTKSTAIMLKTPGHDVVIDNAKINPENGIILQVMPMDDPFFTSRDNSGGGQGGPPGGAPAGGGMPGGAPAGGDQGGAPSGASAGGTMPGAAPAGGDQGGAPSGAPAGGTMPGAAPAGSAPGGAPGGDAGGSVPGSRSKGSSDVNATFKNTALKGDVVNGSTSLAALNVTVENATITGAITSSVVKHAVGPNGEEVTMDHRELYKLIGEITNTYSATDEKYGVKVSLDAKSTWVVDKTSYLTSLTIADGAKISAPEGYSVTMTVNGVNKPIGAGDYKGKIVLTVVKS
jgi:hypothetical protein